jgi:hypothetical protein
LRARYRLILRMGVGRSKLRAVAELLRPVIVEPVLARFKTLEDGMSGLMIVSSRMLGGRRITAADVPALCAPAEMQPPTAGLEAFCATVAARCDARINAGCAAAAPDARFVGHLVCLLNLDPAPSVIATRMNRQRLASTNIA